MLELLLEKTGTGSLVARMRSVMDWEEREDASLASSPSPSSSSSSSPAGTFGGLTPLPLVLTKAMQRMGESHTVMLTIWCGLVEA